MKYKVAIALSFLPLLFFSSCAKHVDIQKISEMSPVSVIPEIDDDIFPSGLSESISASVEKLSRKKNSSLVFGGKVISAADYALALEYLLEKLRAGANKEEFIREVRGNFDFYGFPGETWGEVFVTSYFSPVLSASKKQTPKHTQPLYRVPNDLVKVRIDNFIETFERFSFLEDNRQARQKLESLYGRVVFGRHGQMSELIPYYSRREIDSRRKLKGKNLEIAWVDPLDAFFLQIQGSGKIRFPDGEERVIGYAAQNGHEYVAIGKFLLDSIEKEKMSLWSIETHLRSLSYAKRMEILYKNPSYIFFRELSGKPQTSFGSEVVDGRTIATDELFSPKGALAFMEFEHPVFETSSSVEPSLWKPVSRFVLNHDSGGAIKGPKRVDLFWGEGKDASRHAGVMKKRGKLFYLVPKWEFLMTLREKSEEKTREKIK